MCLHTFIKEVESIIIDSFFNISRTTVLIRNDKMIHHVYSASEAGNLASSQERILLMTPETRLLFGNQQAQPELTVASSCFTI